jgi:hypothetical protein
MEGLGFLIYKDKELIYMETLKIIKILISPSGIIILPQKAINIRNVDGCG